MLRNVPEKMKKAARNVTLRHPNAFNITAYRKEVDREDHDLLGGARVLSSDDEPEYKYTELGDGKLVFLDNYNPSSLSDDSSAFDYAESSFHGLVEPLVIPSDETYFSLKKTDIVYLVVLESVSIAFEITGVPSTIGLSPYGTRYQLTKRDDVDHALPKDD